MKTIKSLPNYMTMLGLSPVPANPVVNGYEIGRVECSALWACTKVGALTGKAFKTKREAVSFAKSN